MLVYLVKMEETSRNMASTLRVNTISDGSQATTETTKNTATCYKCGVAI